MGKFLLIALCLAYGNAGAKAPQSMAEAGERTLAPDAASLKQTYDKASERLALCVKHLITPLEKRDWNTLEEQAHMGVAKNARQTLSQLESAVNLSKEFVTMASGFDDSLPPECKQTVAAQIAPLVSKHQKRLQKATDATDGMCDEADIKREVSKEAGKHIEKAIEKSVPGRARPRSSTDPAGSPLRSSH